MGVKQSITRQQAQTDEQIREGYCWSCRSYSEAKPLASELCLAS